MSAAQYVVGIDLGGTNMQVALIDAEGRIIAREHALTRPQAGADDVIARIAAQVRDVCAQADVEPGAVRAVGIGAPGAIDPKAQIVIHAPNIGWRNIALGDRLSETLAGTPVVVDNDVNVAVLGEARLGAGEGARHMLGVWVGTGVGGGLLLNGRLHYGAFGSAGEIGHFHAHPYNQPGSRSLEHNCSRSALADRITKLINANRPSIVTELVDGDFSRIRSKVIAEAYRRNDALVRDVVEHAADLLGIIIGGTITLLSLERVVMGGGLTEALGEPFVELVRAGAQRVIFPDAAKAAQIVVTQLSDDAGVAGAALLALDPESVRQPEPTA